MNALAKRKESILVEMTLDQLKKDCPNLFCTNGFQGGEGRKGYVKGVTEKYTVIDAYNDVLVPLQEMGWKVRTCQTRESKVYGETATFMLRLFNDKYSNKERATELLMYSSHNGRSSVKFRMGIIEFACANGLIRMSNENDAIRAIKITHKGEVRERLATMLDIIETETIKINTIVKKMKFIMLDETQMKTLALKALAINKIGLNNELYDEQMAIESALQAPQNYDKSVLGQNGSSLFNVFQRIQGSIAKGEVRYGIKPNALKIQKQLGKAVDEKEVERLNKQLDVIRKSQPNTQYGGLYKKSTALMGIDKIFDFNSQIFALAEEMLETV